MPRKKVEKEEEPKKKKKVVKEEVVEEIVEETEENTEEVQEKKINPVLKVFGLVLKIMFYVFIIAFVLVVILQRISGNSFSIFGYRMFNVVSGSMEPKYNIGDVLISKETAPEDIKIGDAISYEGEKGDFKGKVITHEVVGIYKDGGKYIYKAKGLANLVEDPSITQDQLYGVVVYKSVVLSFIYKIVSTKIGFYACIILPLMYILGSEFINMLLDREDQKRRNKKNKPKKKKIIYVEE